MTRLIVAKFGGSVIGPDGAYIPDAISRINDLKQNSKVIVVVSAPLTIHKQKQCSLTDLILEQGKMAQDGITPSLDAIKSVWQKISLMVNSEYRQQCQNTINEHLDMVQKALDTALDKKEFANEIRSQALAFSGEVLMSHVMNYILKSNDIKSDTIPFDHWPIITDNNIESTNFLVSESKSRISKTAQMLKENDVITIAGFIGKTIDNITTTFERGGSDRTAADIGILFHKEYDTSIDFEKDSAVVSADPKIIPSKLRKVPQLSYNEARLAGMFGMKILDPIAIKEIVENGVDIPITITCMKDPQKTTTIKRLITNSSGHPIKIVTGKENCSIFRIETSSIQKLLMSLEKDKRYSEFIILSPFTKDGIEFSRILFLDSDYVKRNEKYLLGFDSLATITYNRGVITLIGDEMWRVQQVVSRTSAKIGQSGLNILNIDAQEETSRIIIVIEDKQDNIKKAIKAIHQEISDFDFT